MNRYCVEVLNYEACPMYNELRCNSEPHFFGSRMDAERFKSDAMKRGWKVTTVIDRENLPF